MQLGEPGTEVLSGAGAGGSQETDLKHHVHLLDFILTSVIFSFWYNSVDMVYCRALTLSPLENKLSIGLKQFMSQYNKQIKCSEIIKFKSPPTQPSDSPNLSQPWLPLSSVAGLDGGQLIRLIGRVHGSVGSLVLHCTWSILVTSLSRLHREVLAST